MNPFTQHPHHQGVSYFQHWAFAMGIACRLLASVVAFALHATLPFISIETRLDLGATAEFLAERNKFIGAASARARGTRALTAKDPAIDRDDPALLA